MPKKMIYLVRHAKSSWKDTTLTDRQRPLNKRGHRNAAELAARMAGYKIRPDLIIASPAKRALTTAQYFATDMDYPGYDIYVEERLYFCGVKGLKFTLQQLDDDINSVMVFGHNPDLSEFSNYLMKDEIDPLPTCTVVHIESNIPHWNDINEGCASLRRIDYPKKKAIKLTLS